MKLIALEQAESQANDNGRPCVGFEDLHLTGMVISAVQQLIRLMADIQQHRACSMAVLSGNAGFESDIIVLKRKINARIAYLETLLHLSDVVDQAEWQGILPEWKTVAYGWRRDYVLHNFELHSHLIDKIICVVKNTGLWLLESRAYPASQANSYISHEMFTYSFTRFLFQIEVLGRLRGLGTHVASCGADETTLSRLAYLMNCAKEEYAILGSFMKGQDSPIFMGIPVMLAFESIDNDFAFWLHGVENILSGTLLPSDHTSRQLYEPATTVINALLRIYFQFLAFLQLSINENFELVLEQSFSHF